MKVIGLDNKTYVWSLSGYQPKKDDDRPRSKYHKQGRILLKSLFRVEPILEEVFLPGSGSLYADFYLPRRNMIVETHGEQHYKYSKLFHDDQYDFAFQKKRDKNKERWCEINKIRFVALPYSEDLNEWTIRIQKGLENPIRAD